MVSVIIPTYNEETAAPLTLRALFAQPGDFEVIVADGGSTDRTRAIMESFEFTDAPWGHRRSPHVSRCRSKDSQDTFHTDRFILMAPKGRASQMNAGANVANGDWLLFLHADTILPDGAIQRLNDMEADHSIQAGGFMHQFSGDDCRLKCLSLLNNFRCTRSRIIYGDQALFIRRSFFNQLGGFPEQPILEDVALCERLTKVTRPLLLTPPVVTDSRKFVKMGILRSFLRILLIILHVEYRLPTLPHAFFQDVR